CIVDTRHNAILRAPAPALLVTLLLAEQTYLFKCRTIGIAEQDQVTVCFDGIPGPVWHNENVMTFQMILLRADGYLPFTFRDGENRTIGSSVSGRRKPLG